MNQLVLHPDCAPGSIAAIDAWIDPTPTGCRAVFVARGDIGQIAVPQIDAPGRFDNLWKTTCFEIFWSHDGTSYREFNLSPSSRWACYDFDDLRAGMRDGPAEVAIVVTASADEVRLEAHIQSDLRLPATIALNGIIEDHDGMNRFWALAFRSGAPEFHATECRVLALEAA